MAINDVAGGKGVSCIRYILHLTYKLFYPNIEHMLPNLVHLVDTSSALWASVVEGHWGNKYRSMVEGAFDRGCSAQWYLFL